MQSLNGLLAPLNVAADQIWQKLSVAFICRNVATGQHKNGAGILSEVIFFDLKEISHQDSKSTKKTKFMLF